MWYSKTVTAMTLLGHNIPPLFMAGAFLLVGCTPETRIIYRDNPIEVRVPVPVMPAVPDELAASVPPPPVIWLAPTAEGAAVCLSDEDATLLRGGVWRWLRRIDAWEQWARE